MLDFNVIKSHTSMVDVDCSSYRPGHAYMLRNIRTQNTNA